MTHISRCIEWVSDGLGPSRPCWPTEPSLSAIETLARQHLRLSVDAPCKVSFFAEGAFNKLYNIEINTEDSNSAYLMRVALPVDPRWKTLSEVATLRFVRQTSSISLVPNILGFDAGSDPNALGYEWMIMERLPGKTLEVHWKRISWEAKRQLVETIVDILARLYDHPFSGIGNIFPPEALSASPFSSPSPNINVGRIVAMDFFWDKHFDQDVPRGPFRSSYEWLTARLSFVVNDSDELLCTSHTEADEDDIEEAEESKALAERLLRLLPILFPPPGYVERSVIHHDDLSFHNILVDDNGSLTGIVDWECVSALPLWKACQFPAFLVSPDQMERPDPARYGMEEHSATPNQLYFEHLLQWEKTQLRAIFVKEMERVRPEWMREHRAAERKADFDLAVQYCNVELSRKIVKNWVDHMEKLDKGETGNYISLRAQLIA